MIDGMTSVSTKLPDQYVPRSGLWPGTSHPGGYDYGNLLRQWIASQDFPFFTRISPDNIEGRTNVKGKLGWFVPGTKDRMQGSDVNIEQLQVGMQILTRASHEYCMNYVN